MNRVFLLICVLALTGCATKNYGRQGELTEFEGRTMTCREIDLETAKVQGFIAHINKESEFDARSVLSFLGDFGIGNLMEKSSAEDSANQRLAQLQNLRARKNCVYADSTIHTNALTAPSPNVSAPMTKTPSGAAQAELGQYSHNVERLPQSLACNAEPHPVLNAKGPGFETYTVSCSNGDALTVRCELGSNCRPLQ